jgi:formylglycine-generating enzyme required for sulfatase activity
LPLAWWDVGQRLVLRRQGTAIPTTAAQLQALLALLTLAVQVRPPLLRALRCGLGLPASAELAAWQSEDVACNSVAITVRQARRSHYEAILQSSIALPLRQQAAAIIAAHHCQLSFHILLEEAQLAAQYAPGSTTLDHAAYFASLARQLWQHHQQAGSGPEDYAENMAYITRQGLRTSSIIWENSPAFALGWALANLDSLRHGHGLPETMPLALLPALQQAVLGSGGVSPAKNLRLLQEDGSLRLEYGTPEQANTAPRLLAQWPSHGLLRWRSGEDGVWQAAQTAQTLPQFDLARHTPLEIADSSMMCTLQRVVRPAWALECGRDEAGLYALLPNPWGLPVRVAWPFQAMEPIAMPVATSKKKASAKVHALTLALDEIGPFATLTLAGKNGLHSQVWRYIAPGQFVMGSPEAETHGLPDQGYYTDERPQHIVTISQGFWLADSACTQGLWQAVMGRNPSRFDASDGGGANHPVERVSWHDTQVFMQKLQAILDQGMETGPPSRLAQCMLTLPTEAEWEYACRAGTSTPFSFGNSISTAQANFDGNYPWRDEKKGEYRQKTLDIKALPANAWGLYQMHGNVWEWCADEKREYSTAEMLDPGLDAAVLPSPKAQAARVVRGGGWNGQAQSVRSAYRDRGGPGGRGGDLGFRLALRSQSQVGRA